MVIVAAVPAGAVSLLQPMRLSAALSVAARSRVFRIARITAPFVAILALHSRTQRYRSINGLVNALTRESPIRCLCVTRRYNRDAGTAFLC
jgi:hypothetical protein